MKRAKRFTALGVLLSPANCLFFLFFMYPLHLHAFSPQDTRETSASIPSDTDSGWWRKVQQDIIWSEYHVSLHENADVSGIMSVYQAPNRAHNLRTSFTPEGIRVMPRTGDGSDWEWGLSLKGYGMKGDIRPVEQAEIVPYMNHVEYRRGENLIEWYVNDENGLEQGFTIKEPLITKEPCSETLLIIELSIHGNLSGAINRAGDLIEFGKPGDSSVINYGKLYAIDSEGKKLPAGFNIISSELEIYVDTADAVFPIIIDPLAFTPAWAAEANQAAAYFGYSVASAGDVNGDGYSDVIVGAYFYDNGESNEGSAFVYHGSSTGLSSTHAWTGESNQPSAYFGYSVASAGDVNGDGYSDIIVGAYSYDNGESDEGSAFVYYGSSTGLSPTPAWTAESNQVSAYFGESVAAAGDINGDGYSDVIVGAPYYDNGESDEGSAFVYHGSSTGLSLTPAWSAEPDQASAYFGYCVASAGDVNGDGYSDVITGASAYENPEPVEGSAFVYHGSSAGLSPTPAWSAESNQASAGFGRSVASAGDVNGDGYSDVIVGAPYYDNTETDEGAAFVYYGSSSGLSATAAWTAEPDQAAASFGCSVTSAGDVNGDGYSDIIVGAFQYDNGESDEGSAFVYHGSATGLSATPVWTGEPDQASAGFGRSVASAGDVNGDGYSDVIVGAILYDNGESDEGATFVYYGSSSGLSVTPAWTGESDQVSANLGHSVASAGDVNGDGYSDVIVGAPFYDNVESNEGRVFVYYGSSTGLSATAAWTAEPDQASAGFGRSVASAGDVNGDGYSDVIVGAPYYQNSEIEEGRVFVYHGSSSGLSTTPAWTAESDQVSAYFGLSVASAGDVNGDGYSDVIVGAYAYDNPEPSEGAAFVYHGSSAGLSAAPAWRAEPEQNYAFFGHSVSTAGDVNKDGYSDVIVGAYSYDNGDGLEGRVFVYHGSSAGLSAVPSWTAEADQFITNFGWSVSSAGDVNGDGYSDVIVGAPQYDNGESDEGRAFVYHGSSAGLGDTPAWTGESNQANAQLGQSVASAGDVNGDGYSDVIAGAAAYDNGHSDEGRVFVYHGSSTGLSNTPAWTAESDQASAAFGQSVASAGDVNGDGYSDVIVGAVGYDNGETNEGGAFVYHGNGGDGFNLKPRQLQADGNTPVSFQGLSLSSNSFRLALAGYTPYGRGKVKLQWEVKPLGTLLSVTGYQESIIWHDTGVAGSEIIELVTDLSADTVYHWQVRFRYSQATTPFQQYSRWFTPAWNGLQEADLRTAIDTDDDGLSDIIESAMCTSQDDADSDDDGIIDGDEDINGNGVVDAGETDPCDADTDGDSIKDGTESGVITGHADTGAAFIPDADPLTTTDPLNADTDGDGYTDGQEDINYNGKIDAGESDPNNKLSNLDFPWELFYPAFIKKSNQDGG